MSVTLQQIADEAGVTRGTVSRVLNGRYKENRPAIARKADMIRAAAERLGYRPNHAARSITSGKFGQVAFVTCGDLGFDWFAPELLHGIHHGLEVNGSRLTINELAGEKFEDPDYLPRLFKESAVDGILANIDAKLPERVVKIFDEQPVPVVLLNIKRRRRCVYPDEFAGGWLAAERLLEQGCRRPTFFMMVDEATTPHYSRTDRLAGFVACLEEAGVSTDNCSGFETATPRLHAHGLKLATEFLDQHPDTDGIACYGIAEANALHTASCRKGKQIPDDLKVIVFDHQVAHALTGIAMDTLIVPFKQVGIQAAEMMHTMTEDDGPRRPGAAIVPYEKLYRAKENAGFPVAAPSSAKSSGDDR